MTKISGKSLVNGDVIYNIFNYLILTLVLVVILYPMYFVVIASISSPDAVNTGKVMLYPIGFTLTGYERIFQDSGIMRGYLNTLFYTVAGTLLSVACTAMIAYPISLKTFSGRKFMMGYLLVSMYFSGGMIPTYLLIKSLNLYDTWMVMVLVGSISCFNIIITRSFFEVNIPQELWESAQLDGCSHIRFFFTIVMPLSGAIIAVIALYYAIAQWNDYMKGLLYLSKTELQPLQLIIRNILLLEQSRAEMYSDMEYAVKARENAELIKYGVIVISSAPILAIYTFFQRYFVKGVLVGAVKG